MSILMTLRVAFKALARNKLRTVLTMLGMIIGVAAVITMVALGTGAQAVIEDQIRGAGTNMIMVFPGAVTVGGARQGAGTVSLITEADAAALRTVPEIEYVSEMVTSQQQVISSQSNWRTTILGVNVDYQNIKSWPTKSGAFFTEADVTAGSKVCVLGSNVAETLFGEDDPTGQELRVR